MTRISHPHHSGLYNYLASRMPKPGTQNMVFEAALANPVFSIQASGIFCGALAVIPERPSVALNLGPLASIGGIQAGTLSFTPLMENSEG
jgi:hypothetical protein